jgi:hypothetical protein
MSPLTTCEQCHPHAKHALVCQHCECNAAVREVWRSVPKFPGYEVSDLGRVRSWRRPGRVRENLARPSRAADNPPYARKQVFSKRGYYTVILRRDAKSFLKTVHTLVLSAFVGPRPPGQQGRHLNGCTKDNALLNLSWGTPSDNQRDKIAHGTYQYGQKNPSAKLSDDRAAAIRSSSAPLKVLSAQYGVRESTISRIRNGVRRAVG